MRIFNNNIVKILRTILLTAGVGAFILVWPKVFVILAAHGIKAMEEWLSESEKDENENIIHQDGHYTIASFGKRKEFDIKKSKFNNKVSWLLCDRDKHDCIDEIRYFTRSSSSPCVYSLGKKGYTRLNYETGEFIQSRNIYDFQGDDKTVFEKLKIAKSKAKNDQEKYEISWESIFS